MPLPIVEHLVFKMVAESSHLSEMQIVRSGSFTKISCIQSNGTMLDRSGDFDSSTGTLILDSLEGVCEGNPISQ